MFYTREKSDLLVIMETLAIRETLSNKQQQYLQHLQKGFAGEQAFDHMTTQLKDNFLILNDLFYSLIYQMHFKLIP